MKKLALLTFMLFSGTTVAISQNDTSKTIIDMGKTLKAQTEIAENDTTNSITELTTKNSISFNLSKLVLGFGLIIIVLETILILMKKINEENTVRFIVVTLIITAALFLITAGYDNDQIAPAIGLIGTIAGYLLGKTEKVNNSEKSEEKRS